MRKAINIFLLALLFFMLVFFVTLRSEGQDIFSSRTIDVQGANLVSIIAPKQWTMIEKVEEGKELLKNSPKLEVIEKNRKVIRKQIELAILNIETGEVFLKRYWLENSDIDKANNARKVYRGNPDLPRFTPVDPKEEFNVINNWWNGWASDWSIERTGETDNDIFIVVADKYSVPNSYIIYPEDQTGPKYSDIVFSPPSEALHDPDLVNMGRSFLNENVDAAFDELEKLKIMSRAFPGQLLVDTISKKFVKNILLVEQTDPDAILNRAKTDEEKKHVAEKVLLRYGLNGNKSFRYTVSSAGAVGPAQVMASTGNSIFKRYPGAKLISDIDLARVDMKNAIKLEIMVFDDHMVEVKDRVSNSGSRAIKVFDNLTPDQLDEVRAMIYNGGASKYNLSTGGLKVGVPGYSETKLFIEKLRVIRYLKLFE